MACQNPVLSLVADGIARVVRLVLPGRVRVISVRGAFDRNVDAYGAVMQALRRYAIANRTGAHRYAGGQRTEKMAAQEARVQRATQWMQGQLMHSVAEALKTAWVLDCDTTIKPLYGHQAGAELGYNPHKPGRPSHAIHTYWIGNLRLVLQSRRSKQDFADGDS